MASILEITPRHILHFSTPTLNFHVSGLKNNLNTVDVALFQTTSHPFPSIQLTASRVAASTLEGAPPGTQMYVAHLPSTKLIGTIYATLGASSGDTNDLHFIQIAKVQADHPSVVTVSATMVLHNSFDISSPISTARSP